MTHAEYASELSWYIFAECERITRKPLFEPRTQDEHTLCVALMAAMNLDLLDAEARQELFA